VWDIETSIDGSFESTEDPGPGRGSVETNIQNGSECLGLTVNTLHAVVLSCDVLLTLIDGI